MFGQSGYPTVPYGDYGDPNANNYHYRLVNINGNTFLQKD